MIKYGCMTLAIACTLAAPAVQAQGNFFVAGQTGRATYSHQSGFDEDSANTRAFSAGYRWQAGPVTQVGVEAGAGKVDEIGGDFYRNYGGGYILTRHEDMAATYRHVGANARFSFHRDSRWFAIARGGYMRFEQNQRTRYALLSNGTMSDSWASSTSDSGDGAYLGAGVGFDVSKNFNVNVMLNGYAYSEFESEGGFEHDHIGTASTTTLGVEVRF